MDPYGKYTFRAFAFRCWALASLHWAGPIKSVTPATGKRIVLRGPSTDRVVLRG